MEKTIYDPVPMPIAPRICVCGCGHEFQPRRRDQIYLNKQHADYGYNHNHRSQMNEQKIKTNKILALNDKILKKNYEAFEVNKCAICSLNNLISDGFIREFHIGTDEVIEDGKTTMIYFTYNYCYSVNQNKEIKIYKR